MKRNKFLQSVGILLTMPLFGNTHPKTIKKNPVITFTPEMLKKNNFGMYIINNKADVVTNVDYSATVSWKLGWNLGVYINEIKGERFKTDFPKYGMINFLTDGWYHAIGHNYEDVCEYLNNHPYGDKFRIMTKDELFYMINERSNQKQLFYENID